MKLKKVKLKLAYGDVTKDELPKGNVTISNLQISINYVQSSGSSSGGSTTEVTRLMYNDGDAVYYDVLNGTTCTNYHEDNSKTGYNGVNGTGNQTSCLKFYAFNDDEGDSTVSLLLDHNTSSAYWNTSGSNSDGPITALEQLKTDTDSWVGTVTPTNYTVSQDYANYTIDYSDYKARLITANEVAEITGNTSFDESTSDCDKEWFHLATNTTTTSDTCKYDWDLGNIYTSGCSYGWLYDRTSTSCINGGCLHNGDSNSSSYWTSTSASGSSDDAWRISYDMYGDDMSAVLRVFTVSNSNSFGLRPVIDLNLTSNYKLIRLSK